MNSASQRGLGDAANDAANEPVVADGNLVTARDNWYMAAIHLREKTIRLARTVLPRSTIPKPRHKKPRRCRTSPVPA